MVGSAQYLATGAPSPFVIKSFASLLLAFFAGISIILGYGVLALLLGLSWLTRYLCQPWQPHLILRVWIPQFPAVGTGSQRYVQALQIRLISLTMTVIRVGARVFVVLLALPKIPLWQGIPLALGILFCLPWIGLWILSLILVWIPYRVLRGRV